MAHDARLALREGFALDCSIGEQNPRGRGRHGLDSFYGICTYREPGLAEESLEGSTRLFLGEGKFAR